MASMKVALVLCLAVAYVQSMCYMAGELRMDFVLVPFPHPEESCLETQTGRKWNKGENEIIDCMNCTCSKGGLECCGIGSKAAKVFIEGCTIKNLPECCYQMISTQNDEVPCGDVVCPEKSDD